MNLMKCDEGGNVNITKKIRNKETNTECLITGRTRKKRSLPSRWNRECKLCKKQIYYSTKGNLVYSLKCGRTLCDKCRHTTRDHNKKYERNCPKCNKILTYSCFTTYERQECANKLCRSCWQKKEYDGPYTRVCPVCTKAIWHTEKKRRNVSDRLGHSCLSCSISRKNRLRHERERQKYGIISVPCFNRKACQYFDGLSIRNKWNLQHAQNGGEVYLKNIGYWLDAYDKEKNIVVEYDEKHHFTKNGKLRKKDVDRMNEICQHLQCEFYRYNEPKQELIKYEYTS